MIHIWTDGSCLPSSGNGGWAALVDWGDHIEYLSGTALNTTNNRMEYTAIIRALEWVYGDCLPENEILVHTDSELVVKHISGEYRVKKNRDLKEKLFSWIADESTPHVTLKWHPRNSNAMLQWADMQAKWESASLTIRPKGLTLKGTQ